MLRLVHAPVETPDDRKPIVFLHTDRQHLAKRLWRGTADNGQSFGFDLAQPLQPGVTFFESPEERYVIAQEPELVLDIPLELTPCAAAGVAWAIGNLHLELMGEPKRLLTPDSRAARQLLDRLGVPFRAVSAVFRPGRFVRDATAAAVQELGPSHRHGVTSGMESEA